MEPLIDGDVRGLARVLWDYHYLDLGLQQVDFVLALGCHDLRVASTAARYVLDGWADLLVTSGGLGRMTRHMWETAEGVKFAEIARSLGVPEAKILVEGTATNTGENILRVRDLLAREEIAVKSGLLVTKPYMRRRAFATASKRWPEVEWLVSSSDLSMENYPDKDVPELRMIELMVGDLQRMKLYAECGFQIPQELPDHVWQAYEELVKRGFDRDVLP